jgi:hypothetical protein
MHHRLFLSELQGLPEGGERIAGGGAAAEPPVPAGQNFPAPRQGRERSRHYGRRPPPHGGAEADTADTPQRAHRPLAPLPGRPVSKGFGLPGVALPLHPWLTLTSLRLVLTPNLKPKTVILNIWRHFSPHFFVRPPLGSRPDVSIHRIPRPRPAPSRRRPPGKRPSHRHTPPVPGEPGTPASPPFGRHAAAATTSPARGSRGRS